MRPGIRETIYQISYWLLPRNKMETVWEPGQEASHSLTWDKIISFCPRFPSRIKSSIRDLGGQFQKLLELHRMLDRGGSDPLPHPKYKLLLSAPVLWLGWGWQQLLGCSLV